MSRKGGYEDAEITVDGEPLEALLKPAGRARSGRMLKKDWVQQVVEAFKLRRDFPNATANAIAAELDQMLINDGQAAPSKLWVLVDQVFTFEDNPVKRLSSKDSRLKRAHQKQKGK